MSQDTATDRTGDVVPALRVAGVVAALGVPLGLLWALLAPPVLVRVVADGRVAPLLGESEHRFDALGVFLLFALAIGVLAGTGAWMVRTRRGPAMLLGVLVGAFLASALGAWTGRLAATAHYAGVLLAAAPGTTVARAPALESAWVVVAAPFAVALTWATLVACTHADDLGR